MINYAYESLFRQDSIDKQISIIGEDISLTNEDIYQNSFSITQSLNAGEDLNFGSCVASTLRFITSDIESSFIGKYLTLSVVIDGETESPLLLGVFKVYEETWTMNRTKKEIIAYDRIYDINNMDVTDWYNGLTFPISLLNFRNSFFNYIGVLQNTASLVNDSFMVQETILPINLTGAMVIQSICELNGVFGRITADNKFTYTQLGTTPVYSITPAMITQESNHEDYSVAQISKVIIRQEENDIGGIAGTGDNPLIIEGNFIAYGASSSSLETVATNILSVVGSLTYVPCEIFCIGNPCVEIGDYVTVTKRDGTSFNTYILNRTLNNIQSMKDEILTEGKEKRVNDLNSAKSEWIQLLGRANRLTRTVEGTVSQVENLGESVTTLTQTSEYLQSEVANINRELNGENITWKGSGVPTLSNYPYSEFTESIPCDGTIQLDEIYDEDMNLGGDQFPHFTYPEEVLQEHVRDLYIDLDTGNGYRFIKTNGEWNWQLIADSDFSILFNMISEVEQTVDSVSASVTNDEMTIADHETRITHNEGELTVQAGQISAKVNSEDENGDSSFSWELKTSGVKFNSNGTDVLTISNTGLKIQGNAEVSGKIKATSGFIGQNSSNGFTIENTAIRNGMTSRDDTSHNGVWLGKDGIALGKGKFKVTNEGTGNIGDWKFSSGLLRIMNGSTQVASINGSTEQEGTLELNSAIMSHYARHLYFEAGSPQGASNEGIIRFDTIGGSHRFVVNVANIELNGDINLNNAGKITCSNQNLRLFASSESDYPVELGIADNMWAFFPVGDNKLRLGTPNHKWHTVYAQTGAINTSDRNEKKNIKSLQDITKEFIMKLEPVSYVFKDGKRTHYGLIAQDVEQVMTELGMTDMDFAGLCKDKAENGYTYGLRYEEFTPMLIKMLQMQQEEIDTLKAEIKEIKELLKEKN